MIILKKAMRTTSNQYILTTVQHRGQNHHISSRPTSRKITSNETRRMMPSNCTQTITSINQIISTSAKTQHTVETSEERTYQNLRGRRGTITDQNVNLLDKKQIPLMKESRGDLTKV